MHAFDAQVYYITEGRTYEVQEIQDEEIMIIDDDGDDFWIDTEDLYGNVLVSEQAKFKLVHNGEPEHKTIEVW